jgi:hypothetical protein
MFFTLLTHSKESKWTIDMGTSNAGPIGGATGALTTGS